MPLWVAMGFVWIAVVGGQAAALPQRVDFNRDVRPILSENCYQCHGPDKGKRQGDLRLDVKDGLFGASDDKRIVTPGKVHDSSLWARVNAEDPDERMPPADSGRALSVRQIQILKRWIEQGAPWKGHWAYLSLERPRPPEVRESPFVHNAIDRFVLDRLMVEGLEPSAEASPTTLLRRLHFDLIGLPPTLEQVDAFLNDSEPDAYERLVDRLIASPHFGERLAVLWLDLVRYADTTGYHGDNHREISLYRDWVIRSFNQNLPFDQFTIDQLAGDLLPRPTNYQLVASGYNKLLQTTAEGGAQPKEYLEKYAADRVRNVSSVWLGATLGCAQCHDHKYDPYTLRDFYSTAAFFADVKEIAVGLPETTPIPTNEQAAEIARLDRRMKEVKADLDAPHPELVDSQNRWEAQVHAQEKEWFPLTPVRGAAAGGSTLAILSDASIRGAGANPDRETYQIILATPKGGLTGLKLELIPDPILPSSGPGRASNGNFVLNEFIVRSKGERFPIAFASADHSQEQWHVAGAVDDHPKSGWAILPRAGLRGEAVFEMKNDLAPQGPGAFEVSLSQHHPDGHTLGRFRIWGTSRPRPIRVAAPTEALEILRLDRSKRTVAQKNQLSSYYRTIAPELDGPRKELAALQSKREAVAAQMPKTLISASTTPRTMRMLPRGNWMDDSGPVVQPAVPAFLPPLKNPSARPNRLDLAHWLVARENPLVARVFVNRIWKLLFGQGIVASLEDFGSQGAWPTHPELLDWLAVDFQEGGWDVKRLIKLIVQSGAYRQRSDASEPIRSRDPYNKLLARQGRFRLDAEFVRDDALAISGLLVPKIGGPSVKPYQPAGYWSYLNFPIRDYYPDKGEGQYRRGLYTYWQRTFTHPSLRAFDAPSREECCVERPQSNTPLQALVLLNDPTYVEAARAFAERILRAPGSNEIERLRFAYRVALSRSPDQDEEKVLLGVLHRSLDRKNDAEQTKILDVGVHPKSKELDPRQTAAWTAVARVLLNLHETITRY